MIEGGSNLIAASTTESAEHVVRAVVVREPYTGLYGLFWIDADVHEWKRGQYFNKLTLNFEKMMSEAEAGSMPNADGKKTGGNGAPDASKPSMQYTYVNKPGGKS